MNLPSSLLYKYFRLKSFRVNGKKAPADTVLCEGDVISLYISDEFFPDVKTAEKESEKYASPMLELKSGELVYEDDNILIAHKPKGETVHPSEPEEGNKRENVYFIDRVIGHLYKKGEYVPENEQSFTPALCHRLDRNTEGLIVCAKNAEALRIMNAKIRDREIEKIYYCETSAVPKKDSGTLHDFLYKDSRANRVYIFPTREDAKRAMHVKYDDDIKTVVTKYEVAAKKGGKALVAVELITGRTHQIRAHMAYIGCPLVGDGKYGVCHDKGESQHLCAYKLTFRFTSPSGILEYLDGKTFTAGEADFMKDYR